MVMYTFVLMEVLEILDNLPHFPLLVELRLEKGQLSMFVIFPFALGITLWRKSLLTWQGREGKLSKPSPFLEGQGIDTILKRPPKTHPPSPSPENPGFPDSPISSKP